MEDCPISWLPADLYRMIYGMLPVTIFCRMRSCCKLWYNASLEILAQKQLEHCQSKKINPIGMALKFRLPKLFDLSLSGGYKLNLSKQSQILAESNNEIINIFCKYDIRKISTEIRFSSARRKNGEGLVPQLICEKLLQKGNYDTFKHIVEYCKIIEPSRLLVSACASKNLAIVQKIFAEYPYRRKQVGRKLSAALFGTSEEISQYFAAMNMFESIDLEKVTRAKVKNGYPLDKVATLIDISISKDQIFRTLVKHQRGDLFNYFVQKHLNVITEILTSKNYYLLDKYFVTQILSHNICLSADNILSILDSDALDCFKLVEDKYCSSLSAEQMYRICSLGRIKIFDYLHGKKQRFPSEIVDRFINEVNNSRFSSSYYNNLIMIPVLFKYGYKLPLSKCYRSLNLEQIKQLVRQGEKFETAEPLKLFGRVDESDIFKYNCYYRLGVPVIFENVDPKIEQKIRTGKK